MFQNYQGNILNIVGNLHVNFTIVVHSATNITSLFYPVSKLSYISAFAILR